MEEDTEVFAFLTRDTPNIGHIQARRIAEALLFAATKPLDEADIALHLPHHINVSQLLDDLRADYATRGVHLVRVQRQWLFVTAPDLSGLLMPDAAPPRKLSRAALETLAIIAYHQPVTRAEVENIRGVAISKGTVDVLLETGWIRLRGRRRVPGRPITYGTTPQFLMQFGLEAIEDLPGLEELKGAGLFEGKIPADFNIPPPSDTSALADDEDPLDNEG